MKDWLKTMTAVAAGVVVGGLIILLGVLVVQWIVDRSTLACPSEQATSFPLNGGDPWCTPKSEFCEMLRRNLDEDGTEDGEANYRLICAECAEPDE